MTDDIQDAAEAMFERDRARLIAERSSGTAISRLVLATGQRVLDAPLRRLEAAAINHYLAMVERYPNEEQCYAELCAARQGLRDALTCAGRMLLDSLHHETNHATD